MTDYGRSLEFGVSVEPLADPPDWAVRVATAADRAATRGFRLHHRQDRSTQHQDQAAGKRRDHRAKDARADASANGNVGFYGLGLSLSPEQEAAGLLDPEGCERPP